jgi:hypothetical protein
VYQLNCDKAGCSARPLWLWCWTCWNNTSPYEVTSYWRVTNPLIKTADVHILGMFGFRWWDGWFFTPHGPCFNHGTWYLLAGFLSQGYQVADIMYRHITGHFRIWQPFCSHKCLPYSQVSDCLMFYSKWWANERVAWCSISFLVVFLFQIVGDFSWHLLLVSWKLCCKGCTATSGLPASSWLSSQFLDVFSGNQTWQNGIFSMIDPFPVD